MRLQDCADAQIVAVAYVIRIVLTCASTIMYLKPEVTLHHMGRVKRIWFISPMRAAKVQASMRIRAVSPEHPLLAHTSSASRGTFRQKARSLAPLNDWACAVKICHDGMLEDTNSLDAVHIVYALIVGHFSMDVGIFLSFSGHALSVEVQTNHRCKTAKITGGNGFRIG